MQSQVADANLGTKGLNALMGVALMGVLDSVRAISLELALLGDGSGALLGDGSGANCILDMDISVVGVRIVDALLFARSSCLLCLGRGTR